VSKLTRQGLRESLYAALEFGFKEHESGHNLEYARDRASSMFERLVTTSENLPTEILRIKLSRTDGRKVTREVR
jgi:hypothetical protein